MNPQEATKGRYRFLVLSAGLLPAVVFLLFPHDVIGANLDRLLYNPRLALSFVAAFFFFSTIFSILCIRSYSRANSIILLRILSTIAVFLVISDAIRPYVDADGVPLFVPLLLDLLLFAALILLLKRIPDTAIVLASASYTALLVLWTAYSHISFVVNDVGNLNVGEYATNRQYKPAVSNLTEGNVYHLILDAYPQEYFLETIRDQTMFSGFTLYRYFNSNYPRTAASVPGMLRSEYLSGGSFKDFYENAPKEGVWKDLAAAGAQLSLYPFLNGWCIEQASYCYSMENLFRDGRGDIFLLTTVDLWFLKVLPNSVRAILNPEGTATGAAFLGDEMTQGFSISRVVLNLAAPSEADALAHLGSLGVDYQVHGLKQFEHMLSDEASRPASGQYVFWHGMFPHGPRVTNGECEFMGRGKEVSIRVAASCATRLAERLIARLRDLGKLENSLIIIQSDHGLLPESRNPDEWRFSVKDTLAYAGQPEPLDAEYLFELQNHDATIYSTYVIDLFSSALLLVKWPGTHPLQVSDIPVQNVDVAPTILRHFGLTNREFDGVPIQDLDANTTRSNVFIATTRLQPQVPTRAARYLLIEGRWVFQEELALDD